MLLYTSDSPAPLVNIDKSNKSFETSHTVTLRAGNKTFGK